MDLPMVSTVISSSDSAQSALAARMNAGDERACTDFIRDHVGMAVAVAQRILRNESDAMDAVQDAFSSFFRSLPNFRGDSKLSTWLHRIVVNAALMKRRGLQRKPETSIEELLPSFYEDGHRVDPRPAWDASVDSGMNRGDVRELVRLKLDELPDDYPIVLVLRDIEGLATEETAKVLGDSPAAIKTRLHRARQALRTLLEREWSA